MRAVSCISALSSFYTIIAGGTFPERWGVSSVTPIFKNGTRNIVSNYRPISKISIFGKVFESIINKTLLQHVMAVVSPHQHGFIPKRSTCTNLLHFTNYINSAIDNGSQVDVIYTDMSKAFGKLNISILLKKMALYGVSGELLVLLGSYLLGRRQYVTVNGFSSRSLFPTSGVPQGSNLGPTLFIMFINDISTILSCEYLMYADDLKLYLNVKNESDQY